MTRAPDILGVEVGIKEVSSLFGLAGAFAALVGWLMFRASRTFKQLSVEETNTTAMTQAAATASYRELYDAEKERGLQLLRELGDEKRVCERLREDAAMLRHQNDELTGLNVKWQIDVRKFKHDLADREHAIGQQRAVIEKLERK